MRSPGENSVWLLGVLAFVGSGCTSSFFSGSSTQVKSGEPKEAFSVAPPPAEHDDDDDIAYQPTGAEEGILGIDLKSCTRNFPCEQQGKESGKHHPTMATGKANYKAGDVIDMTFTNPTHGRGDWITVVPRDYEDNSWCIWFWADAEAGEHRFNGLPAGDYELREYYGWKTRGQCEVVARHAFSIKN